MENFNHVMIRYFRPVLPLLIFLTAGLLFGGVSVVVTQMDKKWAALTVLAMAVLAVATAVKDMRKFILSILVIDITLGIDIAIQDQEWHRGGPTGFIISLMTLFLVLGYVIWLVERKPKVRFFPAVLVVMIFYLITILLSFFYITNIQLGLYGLFLQVQFFFYFFYLANNIRSWDDLRVVFLSIAISLLLESILMLAQYYLNFSWDIGFLRSQTFEGSAGVTGSRIGGTIGTPNSAAVYLSVMLLLTLTAWSTGKMISSKIALAALGLGSVALILTMTRMAWFSFIVGVILFLPWLLRSYIRFKLIASIVLISIVAAFFFGVEIQERLEAAKTDKTREELAYMAYNIIRENPKGVGENNYDLFMTDQVAHPNWAGHGLLQVHNTYLLIWAERGFIGVCAFVLLLLSVLLQSGRFTFNSAIPIFASVVPAGFAAAVISYSIHMTTEGFSSRVNMQILWLVFALIIAVNEIIATTERKTSSPKRVGYASGKE